MKIVLSISNDKYKTLINALNLYQMVNAMINYGEYIEDCEDIKFALFRQLENETKENEEDEDI